MGNAMLEALFYAIYLHRTKECDMDETTRSIIKNITEECNPPKKLAKGATCTVFYDCVRLTPNDLARLAAEATGHLDEHDFDLVVGIAYEGILFAAAVAGGKQVTILRADGRLSGAALHGRKVMIVDDVIHTGRRVKEAEKTVIAEGGSVVGFACIVDRSSGAHSQLGHPVYSAFSAAMI